MEEMISMKFVRDHLVGFRFNPTDEELINHYLRKRRRFGRKFPCSFVVTDADDLYGSARDGGLHPKVLAEKYRLGDINGVWYFYTKLIPASSASSEGNDRWKREAGNGRWKLSFKDQSINDARSKAVIGFKRYLVYQEKTANGGEEKTDWLMYEYRLAGTHDENWALCKVYHKLLSKNNGAASSSSSVARSPDLSVPAAAHCCSFPAASPPMLDSTHQGEEAAQVALCNVCHKLLFKNNGAASSYSSVARWPDLSVPAAAHCSSFPAAPPPMLDSTYQGEEAAQVALCNVYHKLLFKNNGAASSSSSVARWPDLSVPAAAHCSSFPAAPPPMLDSTYQGEEAAQVAPPPVLLSYPLARKPEPWMSTNSNHLGEAAAQVAPPPLHQKIGGQGSSDYSETMTTTEDESSSLALIASIQGYFEGTITEEELFGDYSLIGLTDPGSP